MTSKLELPEEALREVLINAIAHRDYRNPANIQIYIFYDRIEIHNPGGLVAGLKATELGRRSAPRNPLLFGTLYRMDLVENVGSGLKRIKDAMLEDGLDEPRIEADEHWFTVTFKRKNQVRGPEKGPEKGLEKRAWKTKDKVLNILAEKPHATIAELAIAIDIGARRIRRHLADLKTQGLLRRIGPDKGGPRMSPHALVQQYLNITEHLYSIVTNGIHLRLLRDSSRLIKLSFIEFDLKSMMEEEYFADFAIMSGMRRR